MQTVSKYNPISMTVEAIRSLFVSGWTTPYGDPTTTILTALGVVGLIGVVTIGTTLYLFKKVVS